MNLVTVDHVFSDCVTRVQYLGLAREAMGWQFLPLKRLLSFDVIFIQGNPRVLSNVIASLVLKRFGKAVVIWGQAHTGGAGSISENLRLRWWRGFRNLLVYNDSEVAYLRSRGFSRQTIIGMNNGLNQDAIEKAASSWDDAALNRWQLELGLMERPIVLSVARLDRKNRFDLFLEALPELVKTVPGLLWCVIGAGSEEARLKARANDLNLHDVVRWVGPVYGETELAPWFLSACCLVHPGAIGLSLLHAFGYGLPVVTHDNLGGHMPEIHALADKVNGLLFREGDTGDLAEKVRVLVSDQRYRRSLGVEAKRAAQGRFNTRIMADRFVEIAGDAWSRSQSNGNCRLS